ncbi:hypothetical protein SAMN04488502_106155 [Dendrosporobacter quercicolus]|uniref:Uncharacterized protein n=2 Tax=Dendrosporobacter quercicolus TaxID=146817 RepID=A0A1G9V3J2_9FIRM|nr:hypothetical protein SAMN04488502_106155 [Dendrosporobacter quercicolus]
MLWPRLKVEKFLYKTNFWAYIIDNAKLARRFCEMAAIYSPEVFYMKKLLWILALSLILIWPASASAAGFRVNISIARQADGTALGELRYNEQVVWRLAFSPDGAKPASTGGYEPATMVTPDIVDGFFVFKIR